MRINFDAEGERMYETGTKKCVLYNKSGSDFRNGVAWNGLTGVTENPSGGEATALWADDMKYGSMRSVEEFGATIECYTYPNEFAECNGFVEPTEGVMLGQQPRKPFGICYVTTVNNDTEGEDFGYKIHLVYNASASPSEKSRKSKNDSPEASTFSFECTTDPIPVTNYKPVAYLEIDSWRVDETKLKAFEDILYGTEENDPRLPLPDEVISHFGVAAA